MRKAPSALTQWILLSMWIKTSPTGHCYLALKALAKSLLLKTFGCRECLLGG